MARHPSSTSESSSARWPSADEQISASKIKRGSALEKLIRDNQNFEALRAGEANDHLGYPPWLRVYWRKAHPEGKYAAHDPSGGYPLTLKRVLAWMLSHQDMPTGH